MEMISHLHCMKTGIKHLYCLEKRNRNGSCDSSFVNSGVVRFLKYQSTHLFKLKFEYQDTSHTLECLSEILQCQEKSQIQAYLRALP